MERWRGGEVGRWGGGEVERWGGREDTQLFNLLHLLPNIHHFLRVLQKIHNKAKLLIILVISISCQRTLKSTYGYSRNDLLTFLSLFCCYLFYIISGYLIFNKYNCSQTC